MNKRITFLLAGILSSGAILNAAVLNEWTFESDADGTALTSASNSVVGGAAFSGAGGMQTSMGGLVNGVSAPATNYWADTGSSYNATGIIGGSTSNIYYLRYDLEYDVTNISDENGTMLSLAFSDGTDANLAGFALTYDVAGTPAPPAGVETTILADDLALTGTLSAYAEVNLATGEMLVSYKFGDTEAYATSAPIAVNLSSINDLKFKASGSFVDSADAPAVFVENIRVSDTKNDILWPVANYRIDPELKIGIVSGAEVMDSGQTNTFSIAVTNYNNIASNVYVDVSYTDTTTLSSTADFQIIPSATNTLHENTVTLFDVKLIASKRSTYELKFVAKSDSVESDTVSQGLAVGAFVKSVPTVTIPAEGIQTDKVEPGESFTVSVESTNTGAFDLTGVTNSLVSTSEYVTITPAQVYGAMNRGDAKTATYTVTCSPDTPNGDIVLNVVDSSEMGTWKSADIVVPVVSIAVPTVSATSATINLEPADNSDSASIILGNVDGNLSVNYTITDDGPANIYGESADRVKLVKNLDTEIAIQNTVVTNATVIKADGFSFFLKDDQVSREIALNEFDCKLFGQTNYNAMIVSKYGYIDLFDSTEGSLLPKVRLCANTVVDKQLITYGKVRYTETENQLIVAWNVGEASEFQAIISADGKIQYLYNDENAEWSPSAIIGVLSDAVSYVSDHNPGQTRDDAICFMPKQRLSYKQSGTLAAKSTEVLELTALADNYPNSEAVNLQIAWSNGDVSTVAVAVNVIPVNNSLTVPPDVTFTNVTGSAFGSTSFGVTNTGNTVLNYEILTPNSTDSTYAFKDSKYVFGSSSTLLTSGDNASVVIADIGFDFAYFGNTYNKVAVDPKGALIFGNMVKMVPFNKELKSGSGTKVYANANKSKTEFIVTWENILCDGEPQTFQIVLKRANADLVNAFVFNYVNLTSGWEKGTVQLFGGSPSPYLNETLVNESNSRPITEEEIKFGWDANYKPSYTTNIVVVGTAYDESIQNRAVSFDLALPVVFSPTSGTLNPGESAQITVDGRADAVGSYTSTIKFKDPTKLSDLTAVPGATYSLREGNIGEFYDASITEIPVKVYTGYKPEEITNPTWFATYPLVEEAKAGIVGELTMGSWSFGRDPADTNLTSNVLYFYTALKSTVFNDWEKAVTKAAKDFKPGGAMASPMWIVTATELATVPVTFVKTADEPGAAPTVEDANAMFGGNAEVNVVQKDDGSRVVTWSAPSSSMVSKTYTVEFATDLVNPNWQVIATVVNATSWIDNQNNDEPSVFYRVSVK